MSQASVPPFLQSIRIDFPEDPAFSGLLLDLLARLGTKRAGLFELTSSGPEYLPALGLGFVPGLAGAAAEFSLSDGRSLSVLLENITGMEKKSPYSYSLVGLPEVVRRLDQARLAIIGLDHIGINLPWFASEVHPRILELRQELAPTCLYHLFPSGESWDFILPGNLAEMQHGKSVDYGFTRRPKFEIVSFENDSRPLVQIDVSLRADFEHLCSLFPESLQDPQIGNVWVYLENRFTIDVCLVLNPFSEEDWSSFFKDSRNLPDGIVR